MSELSFHPLTPERWTDFETLFGPNGAYGGCWCMFWRITRSQFSEDQGPGNKSAMRELVESGVVPGILAYRASEPVGWCSIAPRTDFGSLERSPVLRRIDDKPVWSIVCFYVAPGQRGQGVARALIHAAVDYAHDRGAEIVESYPVVARKKRLPPVSSYMGTPSLFEEEGFVAVDQPSETRRIMRSTIQGRE